MGVSVGAPCIDSLIPITGLIIELCRNQQVFAPFFRRTGQRNHALEFICGTPPLPRFTVSQRQLCRNRVNQFVIREFATYTTVKQQLPTVETIQGFLSSHQMAVTQMAIQYCDTLVSNTGLRQEMFPGFDFAAPASSAFDASGKSLITGPLLSRFVGSNLASQPSDSEIQTELGKLMDKLTLCGAGCEPDRTETVVKASCAAVLGSATTLVQ